MDQPQLRRIGTVVSVKGSRIKIEIAPGEAQKPVRVTVGTFVGIRAGSEYLVGDITALSTESQGQSSAEPRASADLSLLGQMLKVEEDGVSFRRGVTCYPAIGDAVELLSNENLRRIYQDSAGDSEPIGSLYQDSSVPIHLRIDDLLTKHFAVLGTTGVGKSSAVAIIIDRVLQAKQDVRVFLIDVHNEYASCFSDRAFIVGPSTLKLPFWLFNLEEFTDVIYGGRPPVEEEIEVLAETIALAKTKYAQYKEAQDRQLLKRNLPRTSGYSVDTPVPYLLQDLIAIIDDRMGRLENRALRLVHHRLIARIEAIRNNARYAFMFENANVGGDVMGELISKFFGLADNEHPITIMQLAGLPTEVVDAVVCVLCRLAFEFGIWSDGAVPLLFICEEAHRYAAADRSVGFTPIRRALSRIAKEGRKYGVTLGLVTQRPAEIDPAIISQCSTLFTMRMLNERDQRFMASAVADAPNLLHFIPLLGTREVIVFGEGVPFPAHMRFEWLPPTALPRSDSTGRGLILTANSAAEFVDAVVDRWRGATMGREAPGAVDRPLDRSADRPQPASDQSRLSANTSVGEALDKAHERLLNQDLRSAFFPASRAR